MENVKQRIKCPSCDCHVNLLISEFGGKVVVEPPEASPYIDKKDLLEHYKRIKGFTAAAGKAWDQEHRVRGFHHAKKILAAIPVVETAKRAVIWTADEWVRRRLGSGNEWNLATVGKWAAEFLVSEAKRRSYAQMPKCCACAEIAVEGTKVCLDCSWCWKCDDAGRPFEKEPKEMVDVTGTKPICRNCANSVTG